MANFTEDEDAILREMIAAGSSRVEIAARLGRSKNAVCGRAFRLGLCVPKTVMRIVSARMRKANSNGGAIMSAITARQKAERKIAAKVCDNKMKRVVIARARAIGELPEYELPAERAPDSPLVALLDLEQHHCRWPYGEVGQEDFGYCGKQRESELVSYCSEHMTMAYRPFEQRRRAA